MNLLSNSLKFTPAGRAESVATTDGEGGALRIAVTDTGMGIEPATIGRISDAFEQGHRKVTRRFGGLGLAICKTPVDLHGGAERGGGAA